jgi:choline transport protein
MGLTENHCRSPSSLHPKCRSCSATSLVRISVEFTFSEYLQDLGWLTAIGWQTFLASVAFVNGTMIQGLIALNDSQYPFHAYHGTLLTIAVIAFAIIFNTLLAVHLPLIECVVLVIHVLGLFAIIIPLWVLAPRQTSHAALLEFSNNGGWPSTGLSAMIGLTTPLTALIGYDCSVHMCE